MSGREDLWEHMFDALLLYRAEHSSADVPRSYVTAEGDRLGAWLHRQRTLADAGTLPRDRRERLDDVGVRWVMIDRDAGINAYRQFIQAHGHGLVPHTYCTDDGLTLGVWVQSRRRQWQRDPVRAMRLWPELEDMGFTWVVRDLAQQWESGLEQLRAYQAQRGDTLVPVWFVTSDGFALGRWVDTRRVEYRAGTLTQTRIAALAEIGMVWSIRGTPDASSRRRREDDHFTRMLNRTVSWIDEGGGTLPTARDRDHTGIAVGRWLGRQRRLARTGRLSQTRRHDLDASIPGWFIPSHPRQPST
ncbi:helicase associated domain-containing protein [Frigoribacterium sp. RIT-PI-h]|uniref:helicase associated domain-containing protein n=1 Tax=Frigoribacterium sp. RIT-PI-h TaxID=1690245 RepID=UPI00128FA089